MGEMITTKRTDLREGPLGLARWKGLCVRAGTIGIKPDELLSLSTIDAFRALVKAKFRAKAKGSHTDRYTPTGRTKKAGACTKFQQQHRAYKWLMAVTQKELDRALMLRQTVADPDIPIDWSGWEAYDTYYDGFQVGRL